MEIFMTTGEKIRKIRKMSGMTQEELANKLSVTRQTISRYTAITDGVESEVTEVTEQEYQELFEEYADSTIIHFAYGASDGCVNEMPES
jgi:transcriptional regulator with XRE-family HTH domain